jgi:hypothetical protein
MRDPHPPAAVGERKVGHFQWVPLELYCLGAKKGNWQALTGAGLLDLLFGLLGFSLIKHR